MRSRNVWVARICNYSIFKVVPKVFVDLWHSLLIYSMALILKISKLTYFKCKTITAVFM